MDQQLEKACGNNKRQEGLTLTKEGDEVSATSASDNIVSSLLLLGQSVGCAKDDLLWVKNARSLRGLLSCSVADVSAIRGCCRLVRSSIGGWLGLGMRLRSKSSVRDGGPSVGLHDNIESDHLNMDVAEDLNLVDTLVIDSDQLFDLGRTLACCLLGHKLTDVGNFREMSQEAAVGSRHVETHLLDKVGGLDSCWGGSSSRGRGRNGRGAMGGRRGASLVGAESRRVMFNSKGDIKGMD